MQIIRYITAQSSQPQVGVRAGDGSIRPLPAGSLAELLRLPVTEVQVLVAAAEAGTDVESDPVRLLPPIDGLTEVWASGVTYRRSSEARQEESTVADVYSTVYDAARPELFFKSPAWRVVGTGEPVGVREDSEINVPEAELALVMNAGGEVVGVTICNDVSSRSIEGENPLYLPQAKFYTGACALGPGITPIWAVPDVTALDIEIAVIRDGATVWGGTTSTGSMRRTFDDLVAYLGRANIFPDGAILSTGTGLVPELTWTLAAGDRVDVTIAGIGTLSNPVLAATTANFDWLTPAGDRLAPAGLTGAAGTVGAAGKARA